MYLRFKSWFLITLLKRLSHILGAGAGIEFLELRGLKTVLIFVRTNAETKACAKLFIDVSFGPVPGSHIV